MGQARITYLNKSHSQLTCITAAPFSVLLGEPGVQIPSLLPQGSGPVLSPHYSTIAVISIPLQQQQWQLLCTFRSVWQTLGQLFPFLATTSAPSPNIQSSCLCCSLEHLALLSFSISFSLSFFFFFFLSPQNACFPGHPVASRHGMCGRKCPSSPTGISYVPWSGPLTRQKAERYR